MRLLHCIVLTFFIVVGALSSAQDGREPDFNAFSTLDLASNERIIVTARSEVSLKDEDGNAITAFETELMIRNRAIYLNGDIHRKLASTDLIGFDNYFVAMVNGEQSASCSHGKFKSHWTLVRDEEIISSVAIDDNGCGNIYAQARGRLCPSGTYIGQDKMCLHGFTPPYAKGPIDLLADENADVWGLGIAD